LKAIVADHGRNLDPKDPADQWRMDKSWLAVVLVDIGISLQAARHITGEEPVEINAMMYSTPNDPASRKSKRMNFCLVSQWCSANCTSLRLL